MSTQQRIDAIKARISSLDNQIAALQPALQAARTRENAAQAALDAFQRTTSIADLVSARNAAAADPGNAQLQQQLAATQESFDRDQAVFVPLLRARDAAGDAVIEARSAIVKLETQAGDLDVEIVQLDPSQASPEAVAFAQENGNFPASPDDPVVQRQIAAETTQDPLLPPQQPVTTAPAPVDDFVTDPDTNEQIPSDSDRAAEIRAEQAAQTDPGDGQITTAPAPVADSTQAEGTAGEAEAGAPQLTPEQQAANEQAAAKANAINQATLNSVYKQGGGSDWRFRLQLAKTSTYFYNAEPPGILEPLAATNGVIFPYTPAINTSYKANYEQYDLVHSNYRGVYYKNSRVDDLNIRGTFTAQDTNEANYLLAVIHFFRSVTKMFYGQDDERGTPPPLVFLSGLGPNQFFDHPCVISNFQYNLPDNVDYIRGTNVNNYGTDLLSRRTPSKASSVPGLGATGNRLLNAGLAQFKDPAPAPPPVVASVNNTQLANYVPTKIEIDLTLIPVQTRSQVSKQFSLKGFANGDLIKGGFW